MRIETHLDYQTILANQARPVHFAIRFQANSVSEPRPQPAAFCLVLDRSGSMAGQPLACAKDAAKLAVRNLRGEDQFALVVFDDEAQTIVPMQAVTNRDSVMQSIEGIHSGGSTNLTGGWMLGRDQLRTSASGATRRLLLLSDGQLNVGIVEPIAVRQVVASGLEQDSIRTSCLGFGSAYNEEVMAEMARVTNGQFYDAGSPEKFPAIFDSELGGLQRLTVQNLRLRLKRLEFCEVFLPLGESPQVQLPDGRWEYAIGDLVSGEERIVCFEVQTLPLPWVDGRPVLSLEGDSLLEVEILYDEIGEGGIASHTFTQTIRIQATQDPGQVKLNGTVVPWVAMQKAGGVVNRAIRQINTDRFEEAIAILVKAMEELRNYADGPGVAEAIGTLQKMCMKIQAGEWTTREHKMAHYRSSHYRKMSSAHFWALDEQKPGFHKKSPPDTDPDSNDQPKI